MIFPGKAVEFIPGLEMWLDRFVRAKQPVLPLPEKITPVGHRGTITHAPENTILAHETAYAMGARAIEFDVRCTSDDHFIVFHDKTLDRTTGGYGRVKDTPLKDIKALEAGSHKGAEFKGEPVPTLREALQNVKGRFAVDIDFKGGPKHSAEILMEILKSEGFEREDAPLVTIFARAHEFEKLKPLAVSYALRPHYLGRRHAQKMSNDYGLNVMGLRRYSFSFAAARNIRKAGLHLFSNTMGKGALEERYQDAINVGSMFIQTDHLDRLVPFLEARGKLETRVLGRNFLPINQDTGASA